MKASKKRPSGAFFQSLKLLKLMGISMMSLRSKAMAD
jgi:hypothetical protein